METRAVDGVALRGRVIIVVRDREGRVKGRFIVSNAITDAGRQAVARLIAGTRTTPFKYVGIRYTPAGGTATWTYKQADAINTDSTVTYAASFTATASWTVDAARVTDDTTPSTVLAEATFTAVSLASGDTIEILYTIAVST